jgi:hypothetical protein
VAEVLQVRPGSRIPVLMKQLEETWKLDPDMRLGQLLVNILSLAQISDPFYLEDHEMAKLMDNWVASRAKKP